MTFLNENILLKSPLAVELYENFAKKLPIVDYHSHLDPRLIAEDAQFSNLAQLWLSGDHYKWRLMRASGIDESLVTGKASDLEKFRAFASVLPSCIGNPIYIWCHMELKTYFGYEGELNAETADKVFALSQEKLSAPGFSVRGIIKRSNVETVCTTDDPADDLQYHLAIAADGTFSVKVLPTFRPDKAVHAELPSFLPYLELLEEKFKKPLPNLDSLLELLSQRLDFFAANGCTLSDHALESYTYSSCTSDEASKIYAGARSGKPVSPADAEKYQTYLLRFLAGEYHRRNMVMQLHFNALRNNNSAMFSRLGPDTGYDAIHASSNPKKLAEFLDCLSSAGTLPKTVVYSLDPNDDKLINSILNCFQSETKGKLQHGSAWWFNDTKAGMQSHMQTLAEYGVLGNFIGMLTDSRSFTSYVRHDYFRRILCDFLAEQVNSGEYPGSMDNLKKLVEGVSYANVKQYLFG